MDGSVADLSKYRLEKAKEDLKTAKDNYCDCGKLCENQMVNQLFTLGTFVLFGKMR